MNKVTLWSQLVKYLCVVDADAAVGEEAVLGALARDELAADDRLGEEVRHRRVPISEILNGR